MVNQGGGDDIGFIEIIRTIFKYNELYIYFKNYPNCMSIYFTYTQWYQ